MAYSVAKRLSARDARGPEDHENLAQGGGDRQQAAVAGILRLPARPIEGSLHRFIRVPSNGD